MNKYLGITVVKFLGSWSQQKIGEYIVSPKFVNLVRGATERESTRNQQSLRKMMKARKKSRRRLTRTKMRMTTSMKRLWTT